MYWCQTGKLDINPTLDGPVASTPDRRTDPPSHDSPWPEMLAKIDRCDVLRTVVVAIVAVASLLGFHGQVYGVPLVPALGLAIGLWPILVEAWEAIGRRRMSMELSMLIAIVAAAVIGEYSTALIITAFVLAAEILEDMAVGRGRDALTDLMSFLPEKVEVIDANGEGRVIALEALDVGDTVRVVPGGRVPVDGTVVSGDSAVDESRVTGESLPADKSAGDAVFAGSTNHTGTLLITAERVGADSSYGRIVDSVRSAHESNPPVMQLADKLASWLVYLALGGALLTWLVTGDITNTISVIIAAGACGVAAGTPLAIVSALARSARHGAYIKDGAYLEKLTEVDTIAFDKTGTLTLGEPAIVRLDVAPGVDKRQFLRMTASAEAMSEHPLARAIEEAAAGEGLSLSEATGFRYVPGQGIVAEVEGATVAAGSRALVTDAPEADDAPVASVVHVSVHVSVDGRWTGSVWLADTIRETSCRGIRRLHDMGVRTLMLTGDREAPAKAVAGELGMDDVRAGLLPEQKVTAVEEEMAAGRTIAIVGDGVNDAAALATADVGVAMGSGTHIAQESADVVLITSDINDLADTVRTARRAGGVIRFNFVGTIVVDVLAMLLAGFGIIGPMVAALVHVGSEAFFILNSARLLPRPGAGERATRATGEEPVRV